MSKGDTALEQIAGKGYFVQVVRTSRTKTATINVIEGRVSITVPKKLTTSKIIDVIDAKHTWIIEKLAIHEQLSPPRKKELVSGEAFAYLGRNYRLKIVHDEWQRTKLFQGRLTVTLPRDVHQDYFIKKALVNWYKLQAIKKVQDKVERYQKIVGVETDIVRIKDFKSRWGSCTPYGDLEFNWVVVMAPNRVFDYVVVHELCHLLHHDHSPQFWREVERVMPDYQECKDWLKTHGHKLVV